MKEQLDRKNHWEHIYQTKPLTEVSWYQPVPQYSIDLIRNTGVPKDASIIDIGGGDSFLIDNLLKLGYIQTSVLDISGSAIERAKNRLKETSQDVNWIASDVSNFQPKQAYDVWHDRAAFHFLTEQEQIDRYVQSVSNGVRQNGYLIIGTFSENGPKKCSGIPIKQYSAATLSSLFSTHFYLVNSEVVSHNTPFDTVQEFTFCTFRKK